MIDSNDRPRFTPLSPNRLQEQLVTRHLPDGTRFSIERIRQMTGAGRVELDGILEDCFSKPTPQLHADTDGVSAITQDLTVDPEQDALTDHDDSEEPELLAPDHIIFYKPGELPVFDGERKDFYALLKSSPITLVLNICNDSPIPNAWVSALEELRQQHSVFNFIRLQDINADNSHAMIYINGNLQNEGFSLSHSQRICLSDVALTNLIKPIILDHLSELHNINKIVTDRVEGVINQGASVKINFPKVSEKPVEVVIPSPKLASIPISLPQRKIDPIELIERKWARKSSDW